MKTLIDLDCLLDTRLATAHRLNPDSVKELLTNGYQSRVSDELSEFTKLFTDEEFAQAYKDRTIDVLLDARPTSLYLSLPELTQSMMESKLTGNPEIGVIEVHVNTWPYPLLDEEKETLKYAITKMCDPYITVKMVNHTLDSLPPITLKGYGYDTYYTYSFNDWSTIHFPGNEDGEPEPVIPAPQVGLVCAGLALSKKMVDEIDQNVYAELGVTNPFELTQLVYSDIIGINFADSMLFSLYSEFDMAE